MDSRRAHNSFVHDFDLENKSETLRQLATRAKQSHSLLNGLQKLVELHGPRWYHVESRSCRLDDRNEIVVVRRVQVVQLVVDALNVPDC